MPSTGVLKARCNARVVSLPHLPSTVRFSLRADVFFGLDFGLGCAGLVLAKFPPLIPALKSSQPSSNFRGQFFPLQCLCGTTLSSGIPCLPISFAINRCAFSTALSKSPSLFSQISIPIDWRLPAPLLPSPACHPLSFVGKCWMICVSSTVKCQPTERPPAPLCKWRACISALAPLFVLAVLCTVIYFGFIA